MKMPDKRSGFTLLELIISLTIIAVIVTVIQNGFHIGIRAWEKGESAIEEQQRYRFVLELIQEQLASAFPVPQDVNLTEDSNPGFRGEASLLEFVSRTSLVPGSPSGVSRVWYRVEDEDDGTRALSFRESRLISSLTTSSDDQPEEEDWHVLLSGVKELTFDYLPVMPSDYQMEEGFFNTLPILSVDGVADETSLWQTSFESNPQQRLPLAVRVRFQADEKSALLYLIVPVGKAKEDGAKA